MNTIQLWVHAPAMAAMISKPFRLALLSLCLAVKVWFLLSVLVEWIFSGKEYRVDLWLECERAL
ncbi:MAG: hypothetical protein COA78_35675 [Blastopirellula sp.]|nr:MAG: hypothetical protein COA78_35675 [Blastopirellula sp.]